MDQMCTKFESFDTKISCHLLRRTQMMTGSIWCCQSPHLIWIEVSLARVLRCPACRWWARWTTASVPGDHTPPTSLFSIHFHQYQSIIAVLLAGQQPSRSYWCLHRNNRYWSHLSFAHWQSLCSYSESTSTRFLGQANIVCPQTCIICWFQDLYIQRKQYYCYRLNKRDYQSSDSAGCPSSFSWHRGRHLWSTCAYAWLGAPSAFYCHQNQRLRYSGDLHIYPKSLSYLILNISRTLSQSPPVLLEIRQYAFAFLDNVLQNLLLQA